MDENKIQDRCLIKMFDFIDSVAYVQLGNDWCPVMYDKLGGRNTNNKCYAVRKAHDASNELKIFNMLNHAKNYADYAAAVTNLHTLSKLCIRQ